MSTTKDFIDSIQAASKEKTSAYDTTATVKRVEGNTAWVHIPGGVEETPVKLTMNAKEGDTVQVRVSDGRAFLSGNATSPPTDDTTALEAKGVANKAAEEAGRAKTAADIAESYAQDAKQTADEVHDIAVQASTDAAEAKSSATAASSAAAAAASAAATADAKAVAAGNAASAAQTSANNALTSAQSAQQSADSALVSLDTVQDVVGVLNWITAHGTMTLTSDVTVNPAHVYFIVDAGGDYVVGGTHYSIVSEPNDAELSTYYELTVDESVQNYVATHIVVDSEGLWIVPDAGGNKVLIATGSGSTYTTAGTYIVGKVNNVDTVLAKFLTTGATVGQIDGAHSEIDGDGMQIYSIDAQGNLVELANVGYGKGTGGNGNAKAPYFSLGQRDVDAYEYDPQVPYGLGMLCSYGGDLYVCIVNMEQGETWNPQHWQLAIGNYSFAEGYIVVASGFGSHAEGSSCKAIGPETHAEGIGTVASGYFSHAEGSETVASGEMAHAQNQKTIAAKAYQTAIGKYNLEDTETTTSKQKALIIGNGTADNARSNALTVDWSGNVTAAGGADLAAMTESSGTYSGGLNDEALLTSATITKLTNWLNS